MVTFAEIKKSFFTSLWFMFLTFPIMVIRVNTIYKTIEWRWERMAMIGIGSFFLSFLWRYLIKRKELGRKKAEEDVTRKIPLAQRLFQDRRVQIPVLVAV
ncbi:MAG: branched-chain amino acid ABC transporter permease, partial [Desulfobacterales bacterium]|nr:branched-chain amino acid ABC transporter permease [Desulfobacterales bacterium]